MPRKHARPSARSARKRSSRSAPTYTAKTADRLHLYEQAVQEPEAELDFVCRVFKRLRGRRPLSLREDFCGTAFTAAEWVKRADDHTAVGVDLHRPTLEWGRRAHIDRLPADARRRITLLNRNVLSAGPKALNVDVLLAMNFSYWIFKTRPALLAYFTAARRALVKDGLFFLDIYGGSECGTPQEERRRCRGFTYVWEQASFNPITSDLTCHIHFDFKRGPRMRRAFTYHWRLWTIPEVRELLAEAGFRASTVYWEGDARNGGGNGVFRPQKVGEPCASFVSYIVAEP